MFSFVLFLIDFTLCKALKPLRCKGLLGMEELETETLLMSGNKKSNQEDSR